MINIQYDIRIARGVLAIYAFFASDWITGKLVVGINFSELGNDAKWRRCYVTEFQTLKKTHVPGIISTYNHYNKRSITNRYKWYASRWQYTWKRSVLVSSPKGHAMNHVTGAVVIAHVLYKLSLLSSSESCARWNCAIFGVILFSVTGGK